MIHAAVMKAALSDDVTQACVKSNFRLSRELHVEHLDPQNLCAQLSMHENALDKKLCIGKFNELP